MSKFVFSAQHFFYAKSSKSQQAEDCACFKTRLM
jgi:hypothetical protein